MPLVDSSTTNERIGTLLLLRGGYPTPVISTTHQDYLFVFSSHLMYA